MNKLIIFLIIIGAIYFLFFKKENKDENKNENKNESEDLILCDKCKTFYPKEEIKHINGKNICKDCYADS